MDLVAHYKQQFRWRDWARAMAALPDLSGQVVLDLGCGIGDQAELLVARGAKVRGFDSNGEVVAAARSRGLSDAEFEQADLRALPGIGAPVDGIWCSFAAAYFPRLGPVLSSWAGHLREGGWIALTEIDDLFGHSPLGRRAAERFEAYAYEALQADRYDFFMGRRLQEVLMGTGFTVAKAFSLPDSELSFDGRVTPDVLAAWQTRLDGMRLFRESCGAEYAAVRDEFLACLAAPEHKSQARVQFVLARKGRAGEPGAAPNSRPPQQLPASPEVQTPDSQRTPSSGGCG